MASVEDRDLISEEDIKVYKQKEHNLYFRMPLYSLTTCFLLLLFKRKFCRPPIPRTTSPIEKNNARLKQTKVNMQFKILVMCVYLGYYCYFYSDLDRETLVQQERYRAIIEKFANAHEEAIAKAEKE